MIDITSFSLTGKETTHRKFLATTDMDLGKDTQINHEEIKNEEKFIAEVMRDMDDNSAFNKSKFLDTSNNILYHTETTLVTQP